MRAHHIELPRWPLASLASAARRSSRLTVGAFGSISLTTAMTPIVIQAQTLCQPEATLQAPIPKQPE